MIKKIIIFLTTFTVATTTVLAQVDLTPGNTAPRETSFTPDSILFSELLFQFTIRCQQYDTLNEWYSPLVDTGIPLDAKYEKILMSVPFFKSYPAFRIDCPNGYVLGIYNMFHNGHSWISYLDMLSFDLHGRMRSRVSWAKSGLGSYKLDDEKTNLDWQILSSTDVANGEILYDFIKQTFIAREAYSEVGAVYRYKIHDDATLELLSIKPR